MLLDLKAFDDAHQNEMLTATRATRFVNRRDRGMIEPSGQSRFSKKARNALVIRLLGMQQFQRRVTTKVPGQYC